MKTGPQITVGRKTGIKAMMKRVSGLTKMSAYVGIPASNSDRDKALTELSAKVTGRRRRKVQQAIKSNDVNNAELLFLFSKGSPAKGIPARPVLEPAMAATDNADKVKRELAMAAKAAVAGDKKTETRYFRRAALAGQNAARKWFTDPRNSWAPNSPATIARKGSDRPGIDTGSMRGAIIGIVEED